MRAYELGIIIDGGLDENEARAVLDRIKKQLAGVGADIKSTDYWGKRRFAYEINHRWEGYYAFLDLTATPGSLDEVSRSMRLADDVVRHLVLTLPDAEAARRGLVAGAA